LLSFQKYADLLLYQQERFGMEQTRKHFTQDYLLEEVRNSFRKGLNREHLELDFGQKIS